MVYCIFLVSILASVNSRPASNLKELKSEIRIALTDMKTMVSESKSDIEDPPKSSRKHLAATVCVKCNKIHITDTYYDNAGLREKLSIDIAKLSAVVEFGSKMNVHLGMRLKNILDRAMKALGAIKELIHQKDLRVKFEVKKSAADCGEGSEFSTLKQTVARVLMRLKKHKLVE